LRQAFVLRTPFGLVTSHRNPNGFRSDQVAKIFTNATSWDDGTPIRIVLRPRSDSDTPLLGSLFPGMAAALEAARRRPEVPIAATDQDNADAAERIQTSLAGATLTQIMLEQRKLRFVPIDGVAPTMDAFETGKYPYAKVMYVVVPAAPAKASLRFLEFLQSPAGEAAMRAAYVLPVRD
jgi:phosphate transport system substrate-binding protein